MKRICGAPASALSAGWRLLTSAALATVALVSSGVVDEAGAKGPGARYCFYGTCHRVKTIAETEALVGKEMRLAASFYDSCKTDRYNPCGLTSSGEVFHPHTADNAASPDLPDGTVLLVRNPANGQTAVVRVNNAGPYWGNRKLDLSRAAAEKLDFVHRGVAQLDVRVIKAPTDAEARYKKHRRYDPVPGHIGRFASSDQAHVTVAMAMALQVPSRVRVASLDGSASLFTGEDADRHGLKAALKSRLASLPQQPAPLAEAPESVPAVAVAWHEAASPPP
ncbi:MAG: RlpA-like double-psi beta-barrel domain-containing protein, partial [Pseudomonadota bacterium]